MIKKITALYRPSDHILFTIPLVLLGYAVAARVESVTPQIMTLLILVGANVAAMSFAFAFNEIEDAEDDKKDPHRANPLARGHLTESQAILIASFAFVISFFLFAQVNLNVARTGILTLVLSFLYSFKPIRFKSTPIFDLLSHGLMLSGLIFLSSYLALSTNLTRALPLFLCLTIFSIYGQFYNQLRDFKEDTSAKLKNTTALLGKKIVSKLLYLTIFAGAACLVWSFIDGDLPLFLIPVALATIPVALLFNGYIDKRDAKTNIYTASLHRYVHVILTLTSIAFIVSFFLPK